VNPIVKKLSIAEHSKLIAAIEKIESSQFQIVFVITDNSNLVGSVTNGDLRRHLLNGGSVFDTVSDCMNRDFRSVNVNSAREDILKLFDLGLGVIPKVDQDGRLLDLITQEYDLASPEAPVLARSRAPVRVSFIGGGSDLTYYFVDHKGLVLSTTVALYCHAALLPRGDKEINIYSEDTGSSSHYPALGDLMADQQRDLLGSVVSVLKPKYGFDLYVHSDFPIGSGLGGSSAVSTAIVSVFNELRLDRWSSYEVAELAFLAERLSFGVVGGWQDQYASTFGGFNLIELDNKKNLVHAIRLEDSIINELEECLILCNTTIKHHSGELHELQRESFVGKNSSLLLTQMVSLTREMHHHLIKGELLDFGRCLDKAWQLKRRLSDSISNDKLDNIYTAAIYSGAVGGKLLGAGAGGYFLFFVLPQHRHSLSKTLRNLGCTLTNFKFESEGVTSWRTRLQ